MSPMPQAAGVPLLVAASVPQAPLAGLFLSFPSTALAGGCGSPSSAR